MNQRFVVELSEEEIARLNIDEPKEQVTITNYDGSTTIGTYLSEDVILENVGTIKELRQRIEKLEKMLYQVYYPMQTFR